MPVVVPWALFGIMEMEIAMNDKRNQKGTMSQKFFYYFKVAFRLLILITGIYFILGEMILPRETFDDLRCEEFDVPWTLIREDGSFGKATLPGQFDVKRNERLEFVTILPENIEANLYLCILGNRQDIEIYVEDELRESYSTKDTRPYGKSSVSASVFMRIKEGDAGKRLRIIYQTDSAYSGKIRPIYYGDKMGIWSYMLKSNGLELFVALIMVVLGVVSVMVSFILRFFYHRPQGLEYLGWGVLIAACWIISNSYFRQLFFPNISLVNDMAFFMVILMPAPFMIYLNAIQEKRYNCVYLITGFAMLGNGLICTILQVCNVVDFPDSFIAIAFFAMAAILLMLTTIVLDCIRGHIKKYRLVAFGVLGAVFAGAAQIYLYFQRTAGYNGVMIAIGLIFLLLISATNTMKDIISIEKEKQKAILANESKSQFLAQMSHEIRTPINAVLGMDEMILRECEDGTIRQYAADIQSAGQSLLALINDILDFSKIDSGKMEILPGEYQLASLLNDCYNMVSMRAKDKGLKLLVENDESLPKVLWGDEVRVRQIIVNLLTNAVKYTKEGQVELKLTGTPYVKEATDDSSSEKYIMLRITVTDTGIGISKDKQKDLFNSFQRIDEESNRNIEGTGLGLAITKKLTGLMGGTVGVESEPGEGSAFWVELPQKIINEQPMGKYEGITKREEEVTIKEESHPLEAPDARILVVDDVVMNLKVFQRLLKRTKAQIDTAESGAKALELLEENAYDLIFLDHMMPQMDGIETFHQFKLRNAEEKGNRHNINTPVIMLTANAIAGVREEYMKEGFTDYMSKPILPEMLEEMLCKYLPKDKIL